MSGRVNDPDVLMPGDAAKILGVSLGTLRRWADAGKLPCTKTRGGDKRGGHCRFRRADVEALLAALLEAGDRHVR